MSLYVFVCAIGRVVMHIIVCERDIVVRVRACVCVMDGSIDAKETQKRGKPPHNNTHTARWHDMTLLRDAPRDDVVERVGQHLDPLQLDRLEGAVVQVRGRLPHARHVEDGVPRHLAEDRVLPLVCGVGGCGWV